MKAYLELLKIAHWSKNLLVFVGVFFAGLVFTPFFFEAALVFAVFCLASSAGYVLNAILDRNHDLRHPRKRHRPLPSGRVSIRNAIILLSSLIVLLVVSLLLIPLAAGVIVLAYLALSALYSTFLKDIFLIDIFTIAFGLILRVLAGTIGIGISASPWLIVLIITVALFLALAKRLNEKQSAGADHRSVLNAYAEPYLRSLITMTATLSIGFYALYLIETERTILHFVSIPIVIFGFFRYLYLLEVQKRGEDPIDDIIRDPYLIASLLLWAGIVGVST